MCGRTALEASLKTIEELLQMEIDLDYTPNKEIFPTEPSLCLTTDSKNNYKVGYLDWGFHGYRPLKKGGWTYVKDFINSRTDVVMEKKTFTASFVKGLFAAQIVTSFDEWEKTGKQKGKRFKVKRRDNKPFLLAGLRQRFEKDNNIFYNSTIHTKEPISWIKDIHDRMPCIISLDDFKELNENKSASYEKKCEILSRFNKDDLADFEYLAVAK